MKIRTLITIKICLLMLLVFTSCNGVVQTKVDDTAEVQIAKVKKDSIKPEIKSTNKAKTSITKDTKTNLKPTVKTVAKQLISKPLALGHKEIRRLLGDDIGAMNFNSKAANTFRGFMANSLLFSKSNSASSGYGSSDYSESTARIQFCANGTYLQELSGHLSIDVEGASALSSGATYQPGYWEVASMPNGMLLILFYSKHSSMLEDSANGFLPFPVAKYTANFVAMPNGDGYSRTANQYCN